MTKVAIVTGSNKGIGLAIVRGLAKTFEGDVYLTSRNEERGLEAVQKLKNQGIHVLYHQLDISNESRYISTHFILCKTKIVSLKLTLAFNSGPKYYILFGFLVWSNWHLTLKKNMEV